MPRTAHIRINHPTQEGVFEVVTVTQTDQPVPNYTFQWQDNPGGRTISGNQPIADSINFTWNGPEDLIPSNFNFITATGTNIFFDTIPSITYGNNNQHVININFGRENSGTSTGTLEFTYANGIGQVGTTNGSTTSLNMNITATANPNPPGPPTGGGGGGGTGCHLAGTSILMSDGTSRNIETLAVGDMVSSYGFNGLGADDDWQTWSSNNADFTATSGSAEIISIGVNTFNAYRTLNTSIRNDHMRITYEHPLLCKRGDVISWRTVGELITGDQLYYRDPSGLPIWIDFISAQVVRTENPFTTYTLDVETEDSYVANGVVAHNVEDGPNDPGKGFDAG